jgi:hypothetical protein
MGTHVATPKGEGLEGTKAEAPERAAARRATWYFIVGIGYGGQNVVMFLPFCRWRRQKGAYSSMHNE